MINLYPSSWYYNAAVCGFLQVLAYGVGEKYVEQNLLRSDGTISLSDELLTTAFSTPADLPDPPVAVLDGRDAPGDLKRVAWWWVRLNQEVLLWDSDPLQFSPEELVEQVCARVITGKRSSIRTSYGVFNKYSNLFQKSVYQDKRTFLNIWFTTSPREGGIKCSFCGQPLSDDVSPEERRLCHRFFMSVLSEDLGSSVGEFPNSFWDGVPDLLLCPLCRGIFLCTHFTSIYEVFANTGNFFVTWFFNKFLRQANQKWGVFRGGLREELFARFLSYNSQLSRSLGAWELQGLEFIAFGRDGVERYFLPPTLCNLLLNPQAVVHLSRIKNHYVLRHILAERYEQLPLISYRALKKNLKSQSRSLRDDPATELEFSELKSMLYLYQEIKKMFKTRERSDEQLVKISDVMRCGQEAPTAFREDGSSLVFRLLELVRLGRKDEAYYLLLRSYVAEKRFFPDVLVKVFRLDDLGLFKNYLFSYIAAIRSEGGNA